MSTINASTIERDVVSFQVQMLNNVDIGNSTSFGTDTKSLINATAVHFNVGGFTFAADGVTVPETGYYVIGASIFYQVQQATNTNDRVAPEFKFYNITQSSNIGPTSIAGMGYSRNLSSGGYSGARNSSLMLTQIASLTASDKIGIKMRRSADTGRDINVKNNSLFWGFKLQ